MQQLSPGEVWWDGVEGAAWRESNSCVGAAAGTWRRVFFF